MNLLSRKGAIHIILALFAALTFLPAEGQDLKVPLTTTDEKADSMYYDAIKAHMLEDDQLAKTLLQNVVSLKPGEAAPYYDLARLYVKDKNISKATEYIKKAIALNDDNKWYKEQYANILAIDNQYAAAAGIYDTLAQKEKDNKDYLLKASLLYERAGNHQQALDLLDQLAKVSGDDDAYLQQKQQIYLQMKDLDKAAKVTQQLIENNPGDGHYYMMLAELYENNKQPEKAMEIYRQALKELPDDPSIQMGLAEHYRRTNDTAKYSEYLTKLVTNKDLDAESQMGMLIELIQLAGDDSVKKKAAIDIAGKLAAMHNQNAQVQDIYGQVLVMNGEPEAASAQFKRSLAVDQSHFDVWQRLLSTYTSRKDADSLIYFSEKAIRLFPNQALAHFMNGLGHLNKKEYGKAANSINRAIDLQPEDNAGLLAEMYSTLGDLYYMDKQYTLSDSSYAKAISLQPDDASMLNNYSYYLSERGTRLEDAEKMSKRALELRPDEATFLDTYGWILYKMGKYKEAKDYVQRAIKGAGENTDGTLFDHLGDIYFKLNDAGKALEYWKKAMEKGSDDPQLDKKIKDKKLYE
jgi:tetratricopeptide (TPR) repeat protein